MAIDPMDWKSQGNCHSKPSYMTSAEWVAWWYPTTLAEVKRVIKICDGRAQGIAERECPVKGECLDYALSNFEFGVWGGTSERQRRRLRLSRGWAA